MELDGITIPIAFLAGVISFFSPCVVVLVPAFLSSLAGVSFSELEKSESFYRRVILVNTLFFIAGFTVVFVTLGAFFGVITSVLPISQLLLQRIGGILLILFGLFTLNLIKIPALEIGRGLAVSKVATSFKSLRSFLTGAAFGIAWTPCVGFILAGILTLAAVSGSALQAASLLFVYSIGLTLPFLAVGLFTRRSAKFFSTHGRFLQYTSYVSGAVLIILGILIFTGDFVSLVGRLFNLLPISF